MLQTPFKIIKPQALRAYGTIAIAGDMGVGKTHLAATVGKHRRVFIIDVEGGTITYQSKKYLRDPAGTRKIGIRLIEEEEYSDNCTKLAYLVEQALDWLISNRGADYDLVVLDSVSGLMETFLRLHEDAWEPTPSGSSEYNTWKGYGDFKKAISKIIGKVKILRQYCHILFLGHINWKIVDKTTEINKAHFHLSPAAWKVVGREFDSLGFMVSDDVGRILYFNPRLIYPTKDRYDLGDIENPTMEEILDKIERRSNGEKQCKDSGDSEEQDNSDEGEEQ